MGSVNNKQHAPQQSNDRRTPTEAVSEQKGISGRRSDPRLLSRGDRGKPLSGGPNSTPKESGFGSRSQGTFSHQSLCRPHALRLLRRSGKISQQRKCQEPYSLKGNPTARLLSDALVLPGL